MTGLKVLVVSEGEGSVRPMGIVVTNDPCRGQGTGKILLLEKQRQRAMEKRRAAEQNKPWSIKENKELNLTQLSM